MADDLILQVGVKILLKNREGKFLLLRRSADKYPEVVKPWDIVGGRIIPGTALLENLKREIEEETGLNLVGSPKLLAAQDIFRKPGHHVVRLTYLGEAEGEINLDREEHDEFCWCDLGELKEREDADEYLKEVLNDWPAE
jgi:ADP-ribose pyrophosphatase YjhB (NUDIX family)